MPEYSPKPCDIEGINYFFKRQISFLRSGPGQATVSVLYVNDAINLFNHVAYWLVKVDCSVPISLEFMD